MILQEHTKLSEHFDWAETTVTEQRGVSNIPITEDIWVNIYKTAQKMEVLRKDIDYPMSVNSWYRSPVVNTLVGGAKNSDHMTGCAVDFICPRFGSPLMICKRIMQVKEKFGFKQLILEHTWVHISFSHIPNALPKLEVLSLLANGKYAIGLTDKNGVPYK